MPGGQWWDSTMERHSGDPIHKELKSLELYSYWSREEGEA